MAEPFRLSRTKQCAKCPWKALTDPNTIPDGYDVEKHKALVCTIARPGELFSPTGRAMACHHSSGADQMYCVGWLHNQLGEGNNIGLRLRMRDCENIRDMKTISKQHQRFEDTLPR